MHKSHTIYSIRVGKVNVPWLGKPYPMKLLSTAINHASVRLGLIHQCYRQPERSVE